MRSFLTAAVVAAAAVAACLSPALASSPQLPNVVSQTPVAWTPNVSATAVVGQTGKSYCNTTYFGTRWPCQSEVYGTAYVNGEVVVAGAFTHACQPGRLSQGLCATGTQVVRNDLFAYQASTGKIDPNFAPVINQGPAWTVIPGPAGSDTVYVGGAFTTVNGTAHSGLVQLNVRPGVTSGATADGSVVTGFSANVVGGYVRALALSPDGKALYVGGQFGSADRVAATGIVRFSAATGALDKSFQFTLSDPPTGLSTRVDAMDLSSNGSLLAIGGTYRQVNGQSRPRLALIATGGTLGATANLTEFTAPILANNCSLQHDYVRGVSLAADNSFLVIANTGLFSDGVTPGPYVCDAVARFNVPAAATATTGGAVNISPSWINFAGGDSFYSVAVSGAVAYTGGHNRWVNNFCGNNWGCEENALLEDGLSAFDVNTGLGIPWWHPETLRGDGTFYLNTFPANTYNGGSGGLVMGTDVDDIAGAYHSENAIFPAGPGTGAPYGPIPSGIFVEEGGTDMNKADHPMCLGSGSAAGAAVALALCLYNSAENWTVPASGATGHITLNGLCLDTKGGATASGTPVVLATCGTAATQQWSQGQGTTLVNQGASMCLNDPGSAVTAGTALTIAGCVAGNRGQVWPLPAAPAPPAGPPTGFIWSERIQKDFQEACLDDAKNSTATGNKVVLWTCRGSSDQEWTPEPNGTIQHGGGFCLDTASGKAVLNPCNGNPSQIWTPLMSKNNELVQQSSGLCLTIPGDNEADGTQPDVEKCQGLGYQTWRLPVI